MKIQIEKILPNPEQPRKDFDVEGLKVLADSIKEHGLINPICVEEAGDQYILVDGERRWRAAKMLGLKEISAEVRHSNGGRGNERLQLALIANLQRLDMNPIEEGRAYQKLQHSGMSQSDIARLTGFSQPTISYKIGLLRLEPEVQEMIGKHLIPLDSTAVPLLLQLPKNVQVRLCKKFAVNHTSAGYIRGVCRRFLNNPDHVYGGGERRIKRGTNPMMALSELKRTKEYDVLVATGELPGFDKLELAAKESCKACALSDCASVSMCRECPAVDLLRRLVK